MADFDNGFFMSNMNVLWNNFQLDGYVKIARKIRWFFKLFIYQISWSLQWVCWFYIFCTGCLILHLCKVRTEESFEVHGQTEKYSSAGKVIETSDRLWRNGFKADSADNEGLTLYWAFEGLGILVVQHGPAKLGLPHSIPKSYFCELGDFQDCLFSWHSVYAIKIW